MCDIQCVAGRLVSYKERQYVLQHGEQCPQLATEHFFFYSEHTQKKIKQISIFAKADALKICAKLFN